MLLTFCTMFRSWNPFLLGLSRLSPLLDHLLVSNPFCVIFPPLAFTAEFSLSSLNYFYHCLAHFSLYNFSLGSLDSNILAVVFGWLVCLFSVCCCIPIEGIGQGLIAQAQRLQWAHFCDFWLTQTGKVNVVFVVTFSDKISPLTEELNLLIFFCCSWLLWPLPLVFLKHIPFITTENTSVKNRFLLCHFNISSSSFSLPHQI